MSKNVVCPHCGSLDVRVKATRTNSISYQCKGCKGYFSSQIENATEDYLDQKSTTEAVVKRTFKSTNGMPPSANDICKHFGFDGDEWSVSRYSYKESERHTAKEGYFTLYQISATLNRTKPVKTQMPALSQIRFEKRINRDTYGFTESKPLKKAILLPDAHIGFSRDPVTGKLMPYHDRSVWDIAFQIVEQEQFDEIIIQGDMLDLPEWSDKFVRTPDMYATTQPALIETAWILRKLRVLSPKSRIRYLEGNHEQRISRLLATHLAVAYGVHSVRDTVRMPAISIGSLLDLDASDIEWVGDYPNNMIWLNNNLRVIHGDKSKSRSGQTADGYLDNARSSVIFAHIHRRERACRTLHHMNGPRIYESACSGMMGNPARTPASTKEHDWQQGFTVVEYQEGDGGFDIQQVAVHEGMEALYGGKVWVGGDYKSQMVSETGWESLS